jgi:hypothetical protein
MSPAARNIPATITVHVPLQFAMRGGRKTVIGQLVEREPAPRTRFDDAIIKAIARAHRWRSTIEKGEYASITELARDRKVNQSYACRLLRLTLLAPDIIERLLDQRSGSTLTLQDLMKPLSPDWSEQRVVLLR